MKNVCISIFNKIYYRLSNEYKIGLVVNKLISTKNMHMRFFYSQYLKNKGVCISEKASIDVNLKLPHPFSVVIGRGCVLGKNVVIYQNVTIGQKNDKYPCIGDNCIIYPNTTIIGDITIGNNCVIGCNSFINTSFPDNSVIAGNPARIVRKME